MKSKVGFLFLLVFVFSYCQKEEFEKKTQKNPDFNELRKIVDNHFFDYNYLSVSNFNLEEIYVIENQHVTAGDIIGTTGRSGNASNVPNPHVHISIRVRNGNGTWSYYVDPMDYFATTFDPENNWEPSICVN